MSLEERCMAAQLRLLQELMIREEIELLGGKPSNLYPVFPPTRNAMDWPRTPQPKPASKPKRAKYTGRRQKRRGRPVMSAKKAAERNQNILAELAAGTPTAEVADRYCLTPTSVNRIRRLAKQQDKS